MKAFHGNNVEQQEACNSSFVGKGVLRWKIICHLQGWGDVFGLLRLESEEWAEIIMTCFSDWFHQQKIIDEKRELVQNIRE